MNTEITEVIFLEVKTGTAKNLNDQEKRLREAVKTGRVRRVEYSPLITNET